MRHILCTAAVFSSCLRTTCTAFLWLAVHETVLLTRHVMHKSPFKITVRSNRWLGFLSCGRVVVCVPLVQLLTKGKPMVAIMIMRTPHVFLSVSSTVHYTKSAIHCLSLRTPRLLEAVRKEMQREPCLALHSSHTILQTHGNHTTFHHCHIMSLCWAMWSSDNISRRHKFETLGRSPRSILRHIFVAFLHHKLVWPDMVLPKFIIDNAFARK